MCEAMVKIPITYRAGEPVRFVWTRCGKSPVEVHHRLTRGRGGAVLDELGEIYHLMCLCSRHHQVADGADAYAGGLLLDGMMVRDGDDHYYQGSDEYLRARYGRQVEV